jgi:hypothetical protein
MPRPEIGDNGAAEMKDWFLSHEPQLRRCAFLAILYSLPGFLTLTSASIIDHDIWSHLRTGQWIIEHRWVPYTDPFSSYGTGKPWVAYSWLFEVLIYEVFRRFGLIGLLAYVYTAVLAIAAILYSLVRKYRLRMAYSVPLIASGLFAMLPLYTPRPWLLTVLLFAIEFYILIRVRYDRTFSLLWCLPAVFALWANVHIQFVYGLFVLGLFTFESPLNRLLGWTGSNDDQGKSLPLHTMLILTSASVAATFVNPYHFRIYLVVLDYLRQPGLYNVIREYAAMDFRNAPNWIVLFLVLGAAFELGRRRHIQPLWVLLLLAGVVLSFRSGRDVWFVVIVAIGALSSSRSSTQVSASHTFSKTETLVIVIAVALFFLLSIRVGHISESNLQIAVAKTYPVEAANVVEERGYPGPLYNQYNWGGYLIWRLPRLPVSIDGRTNVHDVARVTHSLTVWNGQPDWASDPELSAARLVIAQKNLALTQLLRLDSRFEIAYEDPVAVVFIARTVNKN